MEKLKCQNSNCWNLVPTILVNKNFIQLIFILPVDLRFANLAFCLEILKNSIRWN